MQHHLLQDLVHLTDTKAKRSPNQLHLNLSQYSEEDSGSDKFGNQRTMKLLDFGNVQQSVEHGVSLQAKKVIGWRTWMIGLMNMIGRNYSFMTKDFRRRHSKQPESINDTYVLEKDDSNVTDDSSNICNNDNQVGQNAAECVDERVALANLIANLTLDTEENKTILKQLKKANASLTQNEECRLLALKYIEIKEGLKTKAYEISVLNQKHDELVKKSLLTKSQYEGQLKEKSKVISDLKVKEEKDIDKMIEMDK
ncbi:hypothetical protein Tco_1254733 [Tanacetum coccineum]